MQNAIKDIESGENFFHVMSFYLVDQYTILSGQIDV